MTGIVFIVIGILSVFASVFFFTSKNGELRKIMIWKFLTNAIVFVSLGVYALEFGLPSWLMVVTAPYLVVKLWLIRYLIKNIK